jgi:hypothetical protein
VQRFEQATVNFHFIFKEILIVRYQKILFGVALVVASVGSVNVQAALINRGGGMIYDQGYDLTWLQDANMAGAMNWDQATDWANELDFAGYTDWRLPIVIETAGFLPADSEVGHLFNEMGASAGTELAYSHNEAFNLFENIMMGRYWTATEGAPEDSNVNAWAFTTTGLQSYYPKNNDNHYAWAVRDGDVVSTIPTVPVPASIWLFGSALVTFLAVERRKNTDKL